MGVEKWIDSVAAVFGEIITGQGGKLTSYKVFGKTEFPNSLKHFPCAITYLDGVSCSSPSDSGPWINLWAGTTEIHLCADTSKSHFPEAIAYYTKIQKVVAAHRQLGGKVAYFELVDQSTSIEGPLELTYGTDAPHLGLLVHWLVKEDVTGDFTLGK